MPVFDLSIFLLPETYVALFTLSFLEIVLGIDNIIFISLVTNRLPQEQQGKARNIGLFLALFMRVAMLLGISWIIGFTEPVLSFQEYNLSLRDLILLAGGIFLIGKSTLEIHHKIEGAESSTKNAVVTSMSSAIAQIVVLDLVFSFDSILTAIGMTEHVILMIISIVFAIGVMMFFAGAVSKFINERPTLQVLALAFLILIGFMLTIEALHFHVPKGYIYFAVFFSLAVEVVNMRLRKRS